MEKAPTCTANLPLALWRTGAPACPCAVGFGAGTGGGACPPRCCTGTTSTLLPLGDTCRRVSTPLCSSITCTLSTVTGAGGRGTGVGAGTGAGVAPGTTSTFGASDLAAARLHDTDLLRRRVRQVDEPIPDVRPAVVDADAHGLHRLRILHVDDRAERQRAMRRRHQQRIEDL